MNTVRYVNYYFSLSCCAERLFVHSTKSFEGNFNIVIEITEVWVDVLCATRVIKPLADIHILSWLGWLCCNEGDIWEI